MVPQEFHPPLVFPSERGFLPRLIDFLAFPYRFTTWVCMPKQYSFTCLFWTFYLFVCLFLESGKGREKESKRNINVWLPLMCCPLGTWPATQACALTGNRTSDPLFCRPVLSPLSYSSQGPVLNFYEWDHIVLFCGFELMVNLYISIGNFIAV